MFTALAEALAAGLSIWNHKEQTKYIDQLAQLRKDHLDAISRPDSERDDNVIDRLELELRQLASTWSAAVGNAQSKA